MSKHEKLRTVLTTLGTTLAVELRTGDYAEDQTAAPLFGGGRRGKTFVCEGYAESFKLLCDRFGIPCVHVSGNGHAWNYMQMDNGKWYGVDVTWDDNDRHPPLYTYFLVGSNTKGSGGVTFGRRHVEEYTIFYNSTIYPFAYPKISGYAYYVGKPVTISKTNLSFTLTDNNTAPYASVSAKKPSDIGKITWYSDYPEIASVTQNGRITALSAGTARICCKGEDGEILSEPCVVEVRTFMIDTTRLSGCSSYAFVSKTHCVAFNTVSVLDLMASLVWIIFAGKGRRETGYSISAMTCSRVLAERSTGGMSKTVLQPRSPRPDILKAALAKAISTLAVNSGLESSLRLYSMTCLFAPSAPVLPVRMTNPPWGMPLWSRSSSSCEMKLTVVS